MATLRNGWDFQNKTDCLEFLENNGEIANYKECPYSSVTRDSHWGKLERAQFLIGQLQICKKL